MEMRNLRDALDHILDAVEGRDPVRLGRHVAKVRTTSQSAAVGAHVARNGPPATLRRFRLCAGRSYHRG
jgi:hypothetical protein